MALKWMRPPYRETYWNLLKQKEANIVIMMRDFGGIAQNDIPLTEDNLKQHHADRHRLFEAFMDYNNYSIEGMMELTEICNSEDLEDEVL